MKRLLSAVLVFIMIFCFWGCSSEADVTTTDETQTDKMTTQESQTDETPQSTSTEETPQPTETDETPEEEKPKYVSDWMQENFLCDEDPEAAGRTICTNQIYDEEYRSEGAVDFHKWLADCELNWRKTKQDAEGMYGDATVTVRIESLDGSSYMILHDGENGNFIYVSDQDCYVQLLMKGDIGERVSDSCEGLRWRLITQNDDFYMEDASAEELAKMFIAHCMEIDEQLNRKADELLSYDYEVREYEGEELIYVTWTMICYGQPRYTDFDDNGDGSYTVWIKTYLEKTENGVWVNMGYSELGFPN